MPSESTKGKHKRKAQTNKGTISPVYNSSTFDLMLLKEFLETVACYKILPQNKDYIRMINVICLDSLKERI